VSAGDRAGLALEAAPEEVGMSSAGLQRLHRLVQSYVDDGKIPGAIVMVARGGKVVHHGVHGLMDREAGLPMRADAIFRIYSMTKPIASVALMQLYEAGAFQLDDPVARFIPEWRDLKVFDDGTADDFEVRDPRRPMTVRDVLMHTSGLVSTATEHPVGELYRRAKLFGSRSGGTLSDMIAKVAELPLKCDPGAEWNYGISTDVVGCLVERISGQRFDHYLQANILDPLGMVDTAFHIEPAQVERFCACYQRASGAQAYELVDAPASSTYLGQKTYFSGAGGLVSTAADYMRFTRMLAAGGRYGGARILGARTLAYMASNHLSNGGDLASMGQPRFTESTTEGIGFGLGFAVLLDPTRTQVVGTPGEYYWGGAASTAFFVSPAEDLSMIFLTQLLPSGTYAFRRELRAAIYGAIDD
jgi:CubicO group peptidase (beta-lactamase class C family)